MFSSPSDTIHAIAYPLAFDADRGRFAKVIDYERYVRDLVLQTLLSAPGERINRPQFGTMISQLVFAGVDRQIADLVKAQVRRAFDRWLGDIVRIETVETRQPEPGTLIIEVGYVILATGTSDVLTRTIAE